MTLNWLEQSAGVPKENTKNKKGKGKAPPSVPKPNMQQPKGPKKTVRTEDGTQQDANKEGGDDEEEAAEPVVLAEVDMLDSLTGNPLPEDEILFAVPVVAPYNSLQNYK